MWREDPRPADEWMELSRTGPESLMGDRRPCAAGENRSSVPPLLSSRPLPSSAPLLLPLALRAPLAVSAPDFDDQSCSTQCGRSSEFRPSMTSSKHCLMNQALPCAF